jgi:hypothetical protein
MLMQTWQIRIPGNTNDKELCNYLSKTLNQMVIITHRRVKNLERALCSWPDPGIQVLMQHYTNWSMQCNKKAKLANIHLP